MNGKTSVYFFWENIIYGTENDRLDTRLWFISSFYPDFNAAWSLADHHSLLVWSAGTADRFLNKSLWLCFNLHTIVDKYWLASTYRPSKMLYVYACWLYLSSWLLAKKKNFAISSLWLDESSSFSTKKGCFIRFDVCFLWELNAVSSHPREKRIEKQKIVLLLIRIKAQHC